MSQELNYVAPSRTDRKSRERIFTPEEEEDLRGRYNYDPETGIFTWKRNSRNGIMKAGDLAGCATGDGHGEKGKRWVLSFDDRQIRAHRVAFFFMMGRWPLPGMEIDHRDGNGLNNRWSNIREATRIENSRNRSTPRHNTLGYKGVIYLSRPGLTKRFLARIVVQGKAHNLGIYSTPAEASEAYLSAAMFLHGEFVNLD